MLETKENSSALSKPRSFKDRPAKFTRSLLGKTEEHGVYGGVPGMTVVRVRTESSSEQGPRRVPSVDAGGEGREL